MPAATNPDRPRPHSLRDLFVSFTWLALQGFGGAFVVIQHELVSRKRWLTEEEFLEDWAVAQVMPGPNALNLAIMLGGRYFGVAGVLVTLAGMLTAPLLLLLVLASLYTQFAHAPVVVGALRGMGAVAAGLVLAAGIKLIPALRNNPLGLKTCLLLGMGCWVVVVVFHWPLIVVLLSLGGLSCLLTYRKLGR
ncbi:MAG: chromate transporter [Rhodoferax sp.]|uniref:chromate transporter n=1 Tax=Rhodoferax sp. TaxID=50421 RepID=UPI001B738D78|nr:chromate transporter [Rhodoferax sp.]MBP8286402.1 chromate transporter [Rhodoferax sp.]MBP9150139.1 chromate transporter [Rhodoferax sp.]MBP9737392.1 chromate transporter [Rhodoferax sp.]